MFITVRKVFNLVIFPMVALVNIIINYFSQVSMPSPKICVCFSQVIEKRYLFREGNQVGIYLFLDKVASYILKNMVSSLSSRGGFFF